MKKPVFAILECDPNTDEYLSINIDQLNIRDDINPIIKGTKTMQEMYDAIYRHLVTLNVTLVLDKTWAGKKALSPVDWHQQTKWV